MTPEGITPKVTIPSPSLIIKRDHRSDLYADYYDSWTDFLDALTDFLDALAKAYHDTIQHFYDLEGLPEDLTLATHICRVNFK